MARAPKRMTMAQYLRSNTDRKEDGQNAALVGMTTAAFKKTAQAKAIDRQMVSLLNRTSTRGRRH
ncbi:hypothetical protein [Komagataeibacter phage phiKX1]|nr:hypothetical protein [Komagataeibacter sp. FNDCR1]BCZ76056.1 hypothetical protein [Komagataeibacter phage phiKX1]BCZ76129.1 hypothetical protein [Komagataeibacter phage phiKX2]